MTKQDIIAFISAASGAYSPYQIFYDWVECLALATANSSTLFHDAVWEEREKRYLDVMNRHDEKTRQQFLEMTAALMDVYECGFDDVLGDIYMKSGCGNGHLGQFFTPYHISQLTAAAGIDAQLYHFDENDIIQNPDDEIIRLNEPSTGGGANIIAAAEYLHSKGIDYQKRLKVVAQDLDWLAVYMTYIACSYYGIDAIVVQGDTLLHPFDPANTPERHILRTPRNRGCLI
ncbi:MAG: SAM-dependent methyltransferase [Lachnospiraceae bacterium]|nr:SAM-dependent methyltransferase [Lachnospiraceae bacterium]